MPPDAFPRLKNTCMSKMCLPPGLCPGPRWWSTQCSPRPTNYRNSYMGYYWTPKIQDGGDLDAKMQKHNFFQKLSNLELWCLLRPIRSYVSLTGVFKEPIIGSLQSKIAEIRHLENRHDVIFFWIKFLRLVQNDVSAAVMCGNGNQM